MEQFNRRRFLAGAAAGVALFNINHAWSRDVHYDGTPFDAGGATVRFSCWPGFWEALERKTLLDRFEKTYNCKVVYDGEFPWWPRYVDDSTGAPPFALSNWNLPEMFQVAQAGDHFVAQDELVANLPEIGNCWPFALANGVGVTWAYGRLCFAYMTDSGILPPERFADFWDPRFDGRRVLLERENDIFKGFFMTTAAEFGASQRDLATALDRMKPLDDSLVVHFNRQVSDAMAAGKGTIGLNFDGDVYLMMEQGLPMMPLLWSARTILTQTMTVARRLEPMERRLAYALLNEHLKAPFQEAFANGFPVRPTNAEARIPPRFARFGIQNTFEATDDLWIPNWIWWNDHVAEIQARLKEIFAS